MEQKIRIVIEENKKKDTFIQKYVIGKKLPAEDRDFVLNFLKEYEIVITGKNLS